MNGGGAYAVLGIRGCAALTGLMDIIRCVYNFEAAGASSFSFGSTKITDDAAMDIFADYAELTILYNGVGENAQASGVVGAGLTAADRCFAIISATLTLIAGLESLSGWGPINEGSEFTLGRSRLGSIDAILAKGDASWLGGGAHAYGELSQKLAALAGEMEAADEHLAIVVQRQAGQVRQVREELAATKSALVGLFLLVMNMVWYNNYIINLYDTARMRAAAEIEMVSYARESAVYLESMDATYREAGVSRQFVNSVVGRGSILLEEWLPWIVLPPCIGAVTAASVFLGLLIADGNSNAADVRKRAVAYETVVRNATAMLSGAATVGLGAPASSSSTISDFAAVGMMSGVPETAHAAGVPPGARQKRAPAGVFVGAGPGRRDYRSTAQATFSEAVTASGAGVPDGSNPIPAAQQGVAKAVKSRA